MSEMTPAQRRALEALVAIADTPVGTARRPRGWASPRDVAAALWPDSPGWERRSNRGATDAGGALGATMPMKAAQILHRLRALGLADDEDRRWRPTDRGRAAVEGEARGGLLAVRRRTVVTGRAHVDTGRQSDHRALCGYVTPAADRELVPWDRTAPEDRCTRCTARLNDHEWRSR